MLDSLQKPAALTLITQNYKSRMSRVSYLFYRRLAISLGCLESNTGGKKGRKEKSESACSKQDYFFRDSVLRSF